jgi:hypothetical protein
MPSSRTKIQNVRKSAGEVHSISAFPPRGAFASRGEGAQTKARKEVALYGFSLMAGMIRLLITRAERRLGINAKSDLKVSRKIVQFSEYRTRRGR